MISVDSLEFVVVSLRFIVLVGLLFVELLLELIGVDGVVLLEVALGVGDAVEGDLDHDSLHNDSHHVEHDEEVAGRGDVDPLEALVGAAEEVVVVDEDAAQELNDQLDHGDDDLVAHVNAHLLLEDWLDKHDILGNSEAHFSTFLLGEKGLVFTLPVEPVALLVDDKVEDGVDDEEDGAEVQACGVNLVLFALGAESVQEDDREHKHEHVKAVHDVPVHVGLGAEGLGLLGRDVSEQHVHSEEVEVVGEEGHQVEGGDVLGAEIEQEEADQDDDPQGEQNVDQSQGLVFSVVGD